jgi:hypothetical protein
MSSETPLYALSSEINLLLEAGMNRFDPIGFHYLESMVKRAESKREQVVQIVINKVNVSIQSYRQRLAKARLDAGECLIYIETNFPDALEEGRLLFDTYDYQALIRLKGRLALTLDLAKPPVNKTKSSLSALVELLSQSELLLVDDQEGSAAHEEYPTKPVTKELKSLKYYQEYFTKLSADALVNRALSESPENAGPLNPQRLVIRTLSSMHDISPGYLSKLVGFYDATLWLQIAGKTIEASVGQKINRPQKIKSSISADKRSAKR